MGKWTQEELTCPECGWVAQNPNGLRGHRQFKHGVRASGAQLPLQEQDRLVLQSALTQLEQQLDARLEPIEAAFVELQQLNGKVQKQAELIGDHVEQGNGIAEQLNTLTKRFNDELPRIKGDMGVLTGRLNKIETGSVTGNPDQGEVCPKCHKPMDQHKVPFGGLAPACPE